MGCVKFTVKMQEAPPRATDSSSVGERRSDMMLMGCDGIVVTTIWSRVQQVGWIILTLRIEN